MSSATALHSRTLSLYRNLLRVANRWPAQETRTRRVREHIVDRIRTEFRQPVSPIAASNTTNSKITAEAAPTTTAASETIQGQGTKMPTLEETLMAKIEHGERELMALRAIVDNDIEKKFPLPETAPMRAFLPSRKLFALLDEDAQKTVNQDPPSGGGGFFGALFGRRGPHESRQLPENL
ncbi:hypothetical protein HK102_004480 [Quaeritorhiza haematococci]|nr:hypothetical protein HK102_004480 [Quaeritorhiza haematococci]